MNRTVLPIVLIVSAAMATACVEEKAPSVDGVVKVRRCANPKVCTARLGFVVDKNHVLAYVGDAEDADVADEFRIEMAIAGWWLNEKEPDYYYDKETGLALLKIRGRVKPVYKFALEPVEKARAVHAVTVIDGGHVPLVRGVVTATKHHIDTMGDVGIVHNALVGEAGYGSPLFNNCGEVVGVVVPVPSARVENQEVRRPTQTLGGQLAVSAAWLEKKLEKWGATPRGAVSACASERTQLIRAMKLDVLFWILLVGAGAAGATVAFLTVTARNDVGGGRSKPSPSDGRQETDSGPSE